MNMKTKLIVLAFSLFTIPLPLLADDYGFTYQAELKDDKGKSLESRNQTVEIRLWKTATTSESGDLLWGRTYNIYTDENGLFNQEISDSTGSRTEDDPGKKLSAIFCNNAAGTVYLGLKVKDSAGEIVPRQRLFAVPFAGRANGANNLVGSTHNVEGTLRLPQNSSLGTEGLVLPDSSTSKLGNVTAKSVTCSGGDLTAANVAFTGKLTGADGKEVIPVPVGGIIMWTKSSLPDNTHWAICDGKNGTPDLSGRFIVGVGSVTDGEGNTAKYDLNQHEGGVNKHKLTKDEMPRHKHKYVMDDRPHASDKNPEGAEWIENLAGLDLSDGHGDNGARYWTGETGGDANGNAVAHENRPPFYALYYIMRIK